MGIPRYWNNMRSPLFFAGMLCWIISAAAACKPRPFGCYAWDWEETANKGAEKHAFLTKDWHDANCKWFPACTERCVLNNSTFDKSALEKKGIQVACKISDLFCDNVKGYQKTCISSREVEIGLHHQSKHAIKDPIKVAQRNTMAKTARSKVKAILLPVCLIGETNILGCKKYSGGYGEICQSDQIEDGGLNFKDQRFCTVLESALGGNYPRIVSEETTEFGKVLDIWRYTGLPYELATSNNTNFLPGESKDGKTCLNYAERNCRPRPLCEGDDQKMTWKSLEIALENKYALENFGPSECEIACTDIYQDHWMKATGEESGLMCRLLDIEGFPLYRRGRPPFAKFMTTRDNLNKAKFFSGVTADASNQGMGNIATAFYPYPLNIDSIKDVVLKKKAEENLWLNHKTNPFAKKYGNLIKALEVTDCGEDDPKTKICNTQENKSLINSISLLTISLMILLLTISLMIGSWICTVVYCIIKMMKRNHAAKANEGTGRVKLSRRNHDHVTGA